MWRLASLQRRAAALGSDRPKVLDDAVLALEELIVDLAKALELSAQAEDRAVASARVAESTRERYQELYELIPWPYVRTDSRGTILDVNAPAARLLNLSRHAVIGKALSLFIARDRGAFVARLMEFTTGHRVDEWPLEIRPREKQRVWVTATVRVSAARGDDEELHWLLQGS